ncbi:MAG: membrane protein [Firmicutes bacterium]|nr:membrane protein [Bacillota bacterium]
MSWVRKGAVLFLGLFLYAVGILLTIHAGLGVAPWDAFHLGIVKHSSLTLGQTSQLVGLFIIILCALLGETPGWGTLANMYFIGFFIDIIERFGLIGSPGSFLARALMLILGICLMGWATYFYLSAGLGSGPRDGLMLALSRRLKMKVAIPRTTIEVTVLVIGYLLGGPLGIGTLLIAFLVGPSIQLAYSIMRQDPREVKHRTLLDDYQVLVRSRKELKEAK